MQEIDGAGLGAGLDLPLAHVKTAAYPSQTDVNFAPNWPGVIWLIVSLARSGRSPTRAFRINDGAIVERELTVTE